MTDFPPTSPMYPPRKAPSRLGLLTSRPAMALSAPPVPPELPPGQTLALPGRGEVFYRDTLGWERSSAPRNAPTVLLLHGWLASADSNFFCVYEALAAQYRVIALDHRGHGRGMRAGTPFTLEDCADDAAALLRELKVRKAAVLGYSMGGPIAGLVAHRHPELVTGAVFAATASEWNGSTADRLRWQLLPVGGLGLRLGASERYLANSLALLTRKHPGSAELASWMASEFRRADPKAGIEAGWCLARFDGAWLAELGVAAAVIVTNRDTLVPPRKQRTLARMLNATVVELDTDHSAPMTHPGRLAHAMLEAFEQLDGAQRHVEDAPPVGLSAP